jgi:hypothetical protein
MSLDSRLRQGLIGLADEIEPDSERALGPVIAGGRRRRTGRLAAAAVVCVVLGAAGALAIPRLLGETDGGRVEPAAVETFAPQRPFDLGVELSGRPGGMALVHGSLWVAIPAESRVVRLDADSGEQQAVIAAGAKPCGEPGYLGDLGWLWFASCGEREEVTLFDVEGDYLAGTVASAAGIAGGEGHRFWTWSNEDHTVNLYEHGDGIEEKFRVWNSTGIFDGTLAHRRVWVTDLERGMLSPIHPLTGAFPDLRVGRSAGDVEAGLGAVWVADEIRGSVVKVSAKTEKVLGRVRVAAAAGDIDLLLAGGSLWARAGERLIRIAPQELEVEETVRVPGSGGLAAGSGALWVAVPEQTSVWRLPLD